MLRNIKIIHNSTAFIAECLTFFRFEHIFKNYITIVFKLKKKTKTIGNIGNAYCKSYQHQQRSNIYCTYIGFQNSKI